MEINDKLDVFFHAAIEAANGKSEAIIEEQKQIYQENIAAYEKKKQEELSTRVRIAENQVEKEENRRVSEQILQMKKDYHSKQESRKEELFALVEQRLADYRTTPEYKSFLEKKMKEAKGYAEGTEMKVYIDPKDGTLQQELETKMGCKVLVSKEAFGGGIRAVMREKNLLMDESFDRKLLEEKEKFSF